MRRRYFSFVSPSGKTTKVFSVLGKEVVTVENLPNGTKSLNIGLVPKIVTILKHGDYTKIKKKDFVKEYRDFLSQVASIDIKTNVKHKVLV